MIPCKLTKTNRSDRQAITLDRLNQELEMWWLVRTGRAHLIRMAKNTVAIITLNSVEERNHDRQT